MANHESMKKKIRQNDVRTELNTSRKNRIRTFINKVEKAIINGSYDDAKEALRAAKPEIMRGVTKGVLKLNTAARKVSRLSARVKKLQA